MRLFYLPCRAILRLCAVRREMARLLERRRAEIEEAARSESDAVALVRSRLEAQLKQRDTELARALAEAASSAAARERSLRECKAAQAQLQRISDASESERRKLQRAIDEQSARCDTLSRALDDATRAAREAAVTASVEASTAELARRAATSTASEAALTIQRLKQTSDELAVRLAAARDAESSARRKLGDVMRANADAAARAALAAESEAAARDRDRRFAEKRIAALQDELARMHERCAQLTSALDASGRAATADAHSGLVRLEADLAGSAEELANWQGRAQELADALDGLQVRIFLIALLTSTSLAGG
jgi:chromosome segregation ATPase